MPAPRRWSRSACWPRTGLALATAATRSRRPTVSCSFRRRPRPPGAPGVPASPSATAAALLPASQTSTPARRPPAGAAAVVVAVAVAVAGVRQVPVPAGPVAPSGTRTRGNSPTNQRERARPVRGPTEQRRRTVAPGRAAQAGQPARHPHPRPPARATLPRAVAHPHIPGAETHPRRRTRSRQPVQPRHPPRADRPSTPLRPPPAVAPTRPLAPAVRVVPAVRARAAPAVPAARLRSRRPDW